MDKGLLIKFVASITLSIIIALALAESGFAQGGMLASGREDFTYKVYEFEDGEIDLPPTGSLSIRNNTNNMEQLYGTTATIFTFDGNGCSDAETSTSLLEVRFDFENDGKLDTYFSVTKTEKHKYDTPGLKTVRMDVLDRGGNVSSTTAQVYIAENTPPEAYFTVTPKVGTPGTQFVFDTKFSTDHQYSDNLLEYRFDFDGDGRWDTKFKKNKNWKYKFKTPGLKKVTLEVRDPENASSYYSRMVLVKKNTPPNASFTITEQNGGDKVAVYKFDASGSSDSNGSKLKYRWDYNYTGENDIKLNTNWYNSPATYAYFYRSGEYLIKLLVKDEDGAVNEAFASLFVNLISG